MKQKLALGVTAMCFLGIVVLSGCSKEDNGPRTQRDSAKEALTSSQRQAIQNNPNIPANVKALELGFNPNGTKDLPPQIAAHQPASKK